MHTPACLAPHDKVRRLAFKVDCTRLSFPTGSVSCLLIQFVLPTAETAHHNLRTAWRWKIAVGAFLVYRIGADEQARIAQSHVLLRPQAKVSQS